MTHTSYENEEIILGMQKTYFEELNFFRLTQLQGISSWSGCNRRNYTYQFWASDACTCQFSDRMLVTFFPSFPKLIKICTYQLKSITNVVRRLRAPNPLDKRGKPASMPLLTI